MLKSLSVVARLDLLCSENSVPLLVSSMASLLLYCLFIGPVMTCNASNSPGPQFETVHEQLYERAPKRPARTETSVASVCDNARPSQPVVVVPFQATFIDLNGCESRSGSLSGMSPSLHAKLFRFPPHIGSFLISDFLEVICVAAGTAMIIFSTVRSESNKRSYKDLIGGTTLLFGGLSAPLTLQMLVNVLP